MTWLVTRYSCPITTNWNILTETGWVWFFCDWAWLTRLTLNQTIQQHPSGFCQLEGRFPAATKDLLSPASCSVLINAWIQALPEENKKIWWRYWGIWSESRCVLTGLDFLYQEEVKQGHKQTASVLDKGDWVSKWPMCKRMQEGSWQCVSDVMRLPERLMWYEATLREMVSRMRGEIDCPYLFLVRLCLEGMFQ